ncbi:hypothetical protein SAMN06265337_0649 [Hymenobacter gelipurpurascens]|uniref:Uncharacterized protein n=1 Tax=Hymenobacter gelipurpurascens TaxID=89968 RepID=A0A212T961_9BACT|nr:hypothetical protein SAMN06265337_0649 [Hymenobacter gelipurpurascens]
MDTIPQNPDLPVEDSTNDLWMDDLSALSGAFNPAMLTHEFSLHLGLGE